MSQPHGLSTANDTLDRPRDLLRIRRNRRLRGGPMAPFTGGPKGRFMLVRDAQGNEASVLLLSERLGTEVARGEALLADALMPGPVERVIGDWRRTQHTLTFFLEQGSATPREFAELVHDDRATWSIAVAEVPTDAQGAA
ncbi:MAG: hypothetical protein KDA24_15075 [Deltaproteobacteria bacterium]|nr:hypothetical protein [Deltaproteobacteria bacterium]